MRILGLLAVVVLLAGCDPFAGNPEPESRQGTSGRMSTFWAETVDNRRIPCVVWSTGTQGSLSCDWGAR